MAPLKLTLTKKDVEHIKHLLRYEEARVIRRANILNCLHLGYPSGEIAQILNVDPKTVTNVGHAYEEAGLDAALFDDERSGRPIDFGSGTRTSSATPPSTTPSSPSPSPTASSTTRPP